MSTRQSATNCLDEHKAGLLLASYGVPIVSSEVAANPQEACRKAAKIGYPVVLKGAGSKLQHKTERGLVHLHLNNNRDVEKAALAIQEASGDELESFLVQKEIGGRREVMAGFYRDREFGPVILFGLGGTLAEALDDVVIRLGPLTDGDIDAMLGGIRAKKILGDFRGEAAISRADAYKVLMGLSRLAEERPDILEVDINPLKITPSGELVAVDALVSVGETSRDSSPRPQLDARAFRTIFYPKSVAFVGASAQMGKWGYLLVVNTLAGKYPGQIYLVNPRGGAIFGRKVYKNLKEIPGDVDLVMVTVPAGHVLQLLDECRDKNIRSMVLISSGFGEVGEEGRALEKQLVDRAREHKIVVLGPNTMGVSNPHAHFFCTGSTVTPEPGKTAMVSQSGNLGTQLLGFAEGQGLGIRAFAGSGNEAMISIEDYVEAFLEDDLSETVLIYLESTKDGKRFFRSAKSLTAKKPVLLLKGGQTPVGQKAAASHTGAMISDERVFDAMCTQAGIIKVEQPSELLDYAVAFSSLPLPKGPRTAIMTWGGGWGVVTADLCHRNGLVLPELDKEIIDSINQVLPPYWNKMNPIDLVGDQDRRAPMKILEALAKWDGCDAVLTLGILGRRVFMSRLSDAVRDADAEVDPERLEMLEAVLRKFETEMLELAVSLTHKYDKPIINVSLLPDQESKTIRKVDGADYHAVVYESPEAAVKSLSAMVSYQAYKTRINHQAISD